MSSATQNRCKLTPMELLKKYYPVNSNDIEIGPIKVEQDTSTDYESNEEFETPAKRARAEQQEPKYEKLKKRGKNFSAEEELLLVELVQERNDVLNNKKSDAFTWKHKEEAWTELTDNFVAKTGVMREWRQLRDKYLHMKRRAKIELANERAHCLRKKVENASPIVSTVSEKIVAMIGMKKTHENDTSGPENEHLFEGETDMYYGVTGDHDTNDMTVSEDDLTSTSSKWTPTCNTGTVRVPNAQTNLSDNVPNLNSTLEYEKMKLLHLQQNFCRCENDRAQEKHDMEMLEKRIKLDDETLERKLRLQLLEMEVNHQKAKLDIN